MWSSFKDLYKGHNFVNVGYDYSDITRTVYNSEFKIFHCKKCNMYCCLIKIISDSYPYIYSHRHNGWELFRYDEVLTCNEYFIKNIIE